MNQHDLIAEVFERQAKRRIERRNFLKFAGASTVAAAGLVACGSNDSSVTLAAAGWRTLRPLARRSAMATF